MTPRRALGALRASVVVLALVVAGSAGRSVAEACERYLAGHPGRDERT